MTTLEQFILNLNGDLEREYAAWVQYIQHAASLTGLHFAFVSELLDHAKDEAGHAIKLADHIAWLGGFPTKEVAARFAATNSEAMLYQDYLAEKEAINRYKQRIIEANELQLSGTAIILMEILKDEEHHANDLRAILEK